MKLSFESLITHVPYVIQALQERIEAKMRKAMTHVYGKLINSGGNLSSGKVGGDVAQRPLHPFSPDR